MVWWCGAVAKLQALSETAGSIPHGVDIFLRFFLFVGLSQYDIEKLKIQIRTFPPKFRLKIAPIDSVLSTPP